jgi:hypothetical protein
MEKDNTKNLKFTSLNYLAKIVLFFLTFFTIEATSQLNYTLVTTAGSYASECWSTITTGSSGTGTVVWAQGNGTIGNGSGTLNTTIDLNSYQGQTLYLSTYDQYGDGWDGATYTLKDQNGSTVINNTGNSPTNGINESGYWHVESSESFTVNSIGVSISYASSTYCTSGSDPTPTLSNNAGVGTYSSSAGLSINGTTGAIDLSASTAGAYTVTYTDSDSETATANVTVSQPTVNAGTDVNYTAGGTIALDATVSGNVSPSSTQVFSEDLVLVVYLQAGQIQAAMNHGQYELLILDMVHQQTILQEVTMEWLGMIIQELEVQLCLLAH